MSLFKRDPVRDLWRAYIGNTKNLDSYRRLREHWIFSPEGPDTLKAKIAELGSPNPLMSALYLLAKRGEVPGVGVRAEVGRVEDGRAEVGRAGAYISKGVAGHPGGVPARNIAVAFVFGAVGGPGAGADAQAAPSGAGAGVDL